MVSESARWNNYKIRKGEARSRELRRRRRIRDEGDGYDVFADTFAINFFLLLIIGGVTGKGFEILIVTVLIAFILGWWFRHWRAGRIAEMRAAGWEQARREAQQEAQPHD